MNDLLKNKALLYIVGGTLAIIIILLTVRSIVYAFKGDPSEEKKANAGKQNTITESSGNAIEDEERKGEKRGWSEVKLRSAADSIFNALNGLGTNFDPIEKIFLEIPTQLDVLYLIKFFGIRDGEDLGQWLEDDGVTDDVNEILQKRQFNEIIF
jgi:hypothetical protein